MESMRSKSIKREVCLCNLCKKEVGTEYHVVIECENNSLIKARSIFREKITNLVPQYQNFPFKNIIELEILAINDKTTYYFANFLRKTFEIVKEKK